MFWIIGSIVGDSVTSRDEVLASGVIKPIGKMCIQCMLIQSEYHQFVARCLLRPTVTSSSLLRVGAWAICGLCYGQQMPPSSSPKSNPKTASPAKESSESSVLHESNLALLTPLFSKVCC